MELALFLALPLLALLFHVIAAKYNEHTLVLNAMAMALLVISAFLLFQEGITESFAFTPPVNQTITSITTNCTTAINTTCQNTISSVNAYANNGQFTVLKKDIQTVGIAVILLLLGVWFFIDEILNRQLRDGFRL